MNVFLGDELLDLLPLVPFDEPDQLLGQLLVAPIGADFQTPASHRSAEHCRHCQQCCRVLKPFKGLSTDESCE